jgi:peroxiredoxin
VVLLGFWASWCGECRSQLEALATAPHGVDVLAVSLDRERGQVIDTVTALGLEFPGLHDAGGVVGERYDIDDLPHLLLIDQEGIVREEFAGYRKGAERTYFEQAEILLAE